MHEETTKVTVAGLQNRRMKNLRRSSLIHSRGVSAISFIQPRTFKWTSKTLWSYGVGSFQTDLGGTMFWSYLLVFLEQIIGLSKFHAGLLLIIGQLSDGISTPLVSIGIDRYGLFGAKYGKRKSWHLLATIFITFSCPFIYSTPPGYNRDAIMGDGSWTDVQLLLYYAAFIIINQVSCAVTQVSHLSLIPCLTCIDGSRVQLASVRNAFTLFSSIAIHSTTFGLLQTAKGTAELSWLNGTEFNSTNCTEASNTADVLGWNDRNIFMYLALGAVSVGVIFQGFIFHTMVVEPITEPVPGVLQSPIDTISQNLADHSNDDQLKNTSSDLKGFDFEINAWYYWFKCPLFYMVVILYCISRLIINITASYIPFYLQKTLYLP